jgi:crotonobetainyl-CoA:carnitine CoA-transferase CaiB-like acyl-CoA transferase
VLTLAPYRVLDLTGAIGAVLPRLLAGLGAEVIRIEPPGGHPLRMTPPFLHDRPGRDRSLYWQQINAGKRSVTLALDRADGRALLLALARTADILVESLPVGMLTSLGLDWETLHAANPALIVVAMSPFGQTGPRAHEPATDLIGMAAGGLLYLCGDTDRPPVRVSVEQAYAHAGLQGLVGALVALEARAWDGRGDYVDVSMQEAVVNTLGNARLYYAMEVMISRRAGGGRSFGAIGTRLVYPCADGYIAFVRRPESFAPLARWLTDSGERSEVDVAAWSQRAVVGAGAATVEETRALDAELERFFGKHPRRYLYEEGQRRGLLICEVATPRDLLSSPQLAARHALDSIILPDHAEPIPLPGAAAKLSASGWTKATRAPRCGEHSRTVYGGLLGLSDGDLAALAGAGAI